MLRTTASTNQRRALDVRLAWAAGFYLAALCALVMAPSARADLAHGTPLFGCTAPTQGVDSFGGTYPIPATGPDAIKEFHFYIDPPALVSGKIPTGTAPTKVTLTCAWQSALGDMSLGATHAARATAVDNAGNEGPPTNSISFPVPAPIHVGPQAPGSMSQQ